MTCGRPPLAPLPARRRPALAFCASLAAMACLAPAMPAQAADSRIVERPFSERDIVRVEGRTGVQATIAFGEGEAIENVAVGDSSTWQITPNKRADLLFVKPLEATARTNMTVVTNRHTYFFDLVASPKASPVYMLRFTYAEKDGAGTKGTGLPGDPLDPAENALVAGEVPADPAMLNFAWKRVGDARIQPARVYDDGNATYLLWPEKSAVPAILVRNEKGEEGAVNYAVRGGTIVIDDVPRAIVLRAGKAMATLQNTAPPRPVALPTQIPGMDPAIDPALTGSAGGDSASAAATVVASGPQASPSSLPPRGN